VGRAGLIGRKKIIAAQRELVVSPQCIGIKSKFSLNGGSIIAVGRAASALAVVPSAS
jgi:hypothetical protein